jgi:hypothetical protein
LRASTRFEQGPRNEWLAERVVESLDAARISACATSGENRVVST